MSSLFKDIYSKSFYAMLSDTLTLTIPAFDKTAFIKLIFNDDFDGYELKERMRHTARVLHCFLPDNFPQAANSIKQLIANLELAGIKEESVEYMFIPEYISMYGLDDYDSSISAFEVVTQFTSCEFAVRPYILKYPEQMIEQMLQWSNHHHHMVRRLASEGSRPRLPWAIALPSFKHNPSEILPILNNLKHDNCEIVRRSVANNLNDIAKDNPDVVIKISTQWLGLSKETDKLVKHGCRTLLKQGSPEALKLFGFDSAHIELSNLMIPEPKVTLGASLTFSFTLLNNSALPTKLRLEYGIYFKKNNGTLSRKVFKISERNIEPNQSYPIIRNQSFKPITTRKLYEGTHQLSIIINGKESKKVPFELVF